MLTNDAGRLLSDDGILRRMAAALRHRGPDDEDTWRDPEAGIGLAHRRLAVIDLSPAGRQPMASPSGRYLLTFNGEIYNFLELRAELEAAGCTFRSRCDTEVLLVLMEQEGPARALARCHGMFALGVWDRRHRKLFLARDRFGERPLYYGRFGATFFFGSELAALRAHPDWKAQVSREALALYFRYNCVPQPLSIYEGVRQVRPGHVLEVAAGSAFEDSEIPYWDAAETWRTAAADPLEGGSDEVVDAVLGQGEIVCRRQMISDVPLGAFLSGGVDSSLVVAMMQAGSGARVKTFTVGFGEDAYNEAVYAREVARRLGTEHTEVTLSARDALDLVPELPRIYGEPFADSSQLPTLLVSRVTRQHVTVALSGDGADELFGGYTRFPAGRSAWRRLSRWPLPARRAALSLAGRLPESALEMLGRLSGGRGRLLRGEGAGARIVDRLARVAAGDLPEFYRYLVSFWPPESGLVRGAGDDIRRTAAELEPWPVGDDPLRWMMFRDTQRYMLDDILVKGDRAAMSCALETRAPFLDQDLAQLAWRIPTSVHYADGRGKWVLRQALARFLPHELINRPKMGFAIPLGEWLRNDLRDWAETLLDRERIQAEGWLDPVPIHARWRYHLDGNDDRYALALWSVLMFQGWLDAEQDKGARC